MLLRYDRRGKLVRSFGRRGIVRLAVPQGKATAEALATQGGRLILAGSVPAPGAPGNRNLLLARLTAKGGIDRSLGGDGFVTTDIPGVADTATDALAKADGSLVVVGSVDTDSATTGHTGEMVVARYRSDGNLDPTFGTGGLVLRTSQEYGGFMTAEAVSGTTGGRIVVAGNSGVDFRGTIAPFVLQLLSSGLPDPSVSAPFPGVGLVGKDGDVARDVAVDRHSHHIYVGGTSFDQDSGKSTSFLGGLGSDSIPVAGFGIQGVVRSSFPGATRSSANVVSVDDRGRVILAGSAADPPFGALAVERFTATGKLDLGFGAKGRVRIHVGGGWNVVRAVVTRPQGRLLLVGNNRADPNTETSARLTLARIVTK